MRSKPVKQKNRRLISIVSSILILTGCGGSSTDLDRPTKAAELTKEAYDREAFESTVSNWKKMQDGVTDFGDRQIFFFNTQINSGGNTLILIPGCTNKFFDLYIQTDFYIPNFNKDVAHIRLNGGEPEFWNLDRRVDAGINEVSGRGEYAVRFENSKKLFEKLKKFQSFSVKLSTGNGTYQSATFDLGGIDEVSNDLVSAGCD